MTGFIVLVKRISSSAAADAPRAEELRTPAVTGT
jgi:hypothetical protein